MWKVFIDGSAGTTGLRIAGRLSARQDICLLTLPEDQRKDPDARRDRMNQADCVFLCLPDDAAREAVTLIRNENTAVIDTSTAHRTAEGWVYGLPELEGQRERIRHSKRIANPGCHATGFIALTAPLTAGGLLSDDAQLSCFSLTGYSGGGKKMIAEYETDRRDPLLDAPRVYGLSQNHKHLPEMARMCGLSHPPVFCPTVAPYYAGMEVLIPLHAEQVRCGLSGLADCYRSFYRSGLIRYADEDENGFLSAGKMTGRDDLIITVRGNEERMLLTARFDNLGKGASGAAIQNMNLLMGIPEDTGLVTGED